LLPETGRDAVVTGPARGQNATMATTETSRRSADVAALFDTVADTYDSVGVPWFGPIAERLIEALAPAPGERALDVGCGRGAALFGLAEAVGKTGNVTGIDLADRMIAATRADVEARGLTTVDLQVMDAAAPTLGRARFDVIAASLVLFLLPEPGAALSAWRGLLTERGRLGVSTFGPRDEVWVELDELFTPYLPPQLLDARTSGTSGPFASDAGVEGLLTEAGYADVRTVTFDLPLVLTGIDQWVRWSQSHGQRAMWNAVPADEHAALRQAALGVLNQARGRDGRPRLRQQVRLTLGS